MLRALTLGERAAINRHVADIQRILGLTVYTGQVRLNLNEAQLQSVDVKIHARIFVKEVDNGVALAQH